MWKCYNINLKEFKCCRGMGVWILDNSRSAHEMQVCSSTKKQGFSTMSQLQLYQKKKNFAAISGPQICGLVWGWYTFCYNKFGTVPKIPQTFYDRHITLLSSDILLIIITRPVKWGSVVCVDMGTFNPHVDRTTSLNCFQGIRTEIRIIGSKLAHFCAP